MAAGEPVRTVSSMTATHIAPPVRTPAAAPAPGMMTRLDERAFALFATWTIAGLFLDGWAHRHDKPESILSPWHALLYSGVAAAVAYSAFVESRRRAQGLPKVEVAGERLTLVGLGVFFAAGAADSLWHTLFGIEVGVDALLSPTHLALMVGGLLLASGPLRAAWAADTETAPSLATMAPRLVSLVLSTALVSFFFQYASAYTPDVLRSARPALDDAADMWATAGMATVVLSTLLLVGPALVLRRRWALPAGARAVTILGPAALMLVLDGFGAPELLVAAAVAAVVVEVTARSTTVMAVATPAAFWAAWFAAVAMTSGPVWQAELVGAALVMAPLTGAGLALLSSD